MPNIEAETIIDPVSIDEDHIHVVAAILWHPERSDRFLIAQRQKGKHLEDYWEFPGGKLEAGETPWPALKREIVEEIGVDLIDGSPFIRVYHRYPERNVLLDTWLVQGFHGEVTACEQQALKWIAVDEIENYRFPPADLPILDLIRHNARA